MCRWWLPLNNCELDCSCLTSSYPFPLMMMIAVERLWSRLESLNLVTSISLGRISRRGVSSKSDVDERKRHHRYSRAHLYGKYGGWKLTGWASSSSLSLVCRLWRRRLCRRRTFSVLLFCWVIPLSPGERIGFVTLPFNPCQFIHSFIQ